MSGRKSKQKGYRFEVSVRDKARSFGLDAVRVPLSGAAEGFLGDVVVESKKLSCKARAHGFSRLYTWLQGYDALVVKQDFHNPLVVVPLEHYLELLKCQKDSLKEEKRHSNFTAR